MMPFFDYVYYRSCKFYNKTDQQGAGLSGLMVIAIMHFFNLFTIFLLIDLLLQRKLAIGKLAIVGVFVLLLILNGIRYNKLNFPVLRERWDNEDENIKTQKQSQVILYIILSAVLCVGLAIYVGTKRW